jgi:pimeloyl-ACP methyl ester carboxylesterase
MRLPSAVSMGLRRAESAALAKRLLPEISELGSEDSPVWRAVTSACADLRRKGVAARTAKALALASREPVREALRRQLEALAVPVLVVHGDRDPLVFSTRHPVRSIEDAGHSVHLSRPNAVAAHIQAFMSRQLDSEVRAPALRSAAISAPAR